MSAANDAHKAIRDLESEIQELKKKWFLEKSEIEREAIARFLEEDFTDELKAMDLGMNKHWRKLDK